MRPSSARTPRWWQALWRRRYPCGVEGRILVELDPYHRYVIRPMGCGCGYRAFYLRPAGGQERLGCHCPTLKGALRQIKHHSKENA